jgi:ABC-type antimicrobial peptide transport system permease subunit
VYDYDFSLTTPSTGSFVSVQFNSEGLKNIRSFADYLNAEFHIDIEMAQIQSKENFSAVSVTATILTWTIIFFALVSVILFIVNLLRTYFQRVKRNMGTFKAFGMSNRELIGIYILILIAIVSGAIIISLVAVIVIQLLLAICHLTYQGGSPYLLLGNINTLFAILVILASSVLTVYWVMKNQLSATPGDLIYDR